jgi:hypothetical protein
MAQREQQIQLALEDLRTGGCTSIRAAGTAYGIPTVIKAREALAAQEAQEAQEAARQTRYDAATAARELANQSFESLQCEWQIDNF